MDPWESYGRALKGRRTNQRNDEGINHVYREGKVETKERYLSQQRESKCWMKWKQKLSARGNGRVHQDLTTIQAVTGEERIFKHIKNGRR